MRENKKSSDNPNQQRKSIVCTKNHVLKCEEKKKVIIIAYQTGLQVLRSHLAKVDFGIVHAVRSTSKKHDEVIT